MLKSLLLFLFFTLSLYANVATYNGSYEGTFTYSSADSGSSSSLCGGNGIWEVSIMDGKITGVVINSDSDKLGVIGTVDDSGKISGTVRRTVEEGRIFDWSATLNINGTTTGIYNYGKYCAGTFAGNKYSSSVSSTSTFPDTTSSTNTPTVTSTPTSTPTTTGTTPTQENVTKLYVATFNRAPDSAGLNYWVNSSGLKLEDIATSFFDQPEAKEKYPDSSTNGTFIDAIYGNLFNRQSDTAGFNYWKDELDAGRIAKSVFILAVVNGAQNDDANILTNKTDVGLSFAEAGETDTSKAKDIMASITADSTTITSALTSYGVNLSTKAKWSETNNIDDIHKAVCTEKGGTYSSTSGCALSEDEAEDALKAVCTEKGGTYSASKGCVVSSSTSSSSSANSGYMLAENWVFLNNKDDCDSSGGYYNDTYGCMVSGSSKELMHTVCEANNARVPTVSELLAVVSGCGATIGDPYQGGTVPPNKKYTDIFNEGDTKAEYLTAHAEYTTCYKKVGFEEANYAYLSSTRAGWLDEVVSVKLGSTTATLSTGSKVACTKMPKPVNDTLSDAIAASKVRTGETSYVTANSNNGGFVVPSDKEVIDLYKEEISYKVMSASGSDWTNSLSKDDSIDTAKIDAKVKVQNKCTKEGGTSSALLNYNTPRCAESTLFGEKLYFCSITVTMDCKITK